MHVALLEVARKLHELNGHQFSNTDLIKKISSDYYVVNLNDDIAPEILEHYLKTEFTRFNIITDFEYALYDCESDQMLYGKYISTDDDTAHGRSITFPKYRDLVYYFAVRFPKEKSYHVSSLQFWFVLTFALVVILLVYVYSIYTIIQQKRYSELQRDFINNMTHEFKTPLSSILLASNYLKKQEQIKYDQKLNTYTSIIIDQGKKLNSHVEKILNIARDDEHALSIHPVRIQLLKFIVDIVQIMQLKHEKLHVAIDISPGQTILADEFHFSNVIYNLLDNAIKYCGQNPDITIAVTETGKSLKLGFADNGIGISPQELPFIFDKFQRGSTTNGANGFGLGLYYVKKVVRQHHWKIDAFSKLGEGLTITLTIPHV